MSGMTEQSAFVLSSAVQVKCRVHPLIRNSRCKNIKTLYRVLKKHSQSMDKQLVSRFSAWVARYSRIQTKVTAQGERK